MVKTCDTHPERLTVRFTLKVNVMVLFFLLRQTFYMVMKAPFGFAYLTAGGKALACRLSMVESPQWIGPFYHRKDAWVI